VHTSEDDLESYSMQTLPEADLERVEEHLLICAECRDRLEETEQYLAESPIRRQTVKLNGNHYGRIRPLVAPSTSRRRAIRHDPIWLAGSVGSDALPAFESACLQSSGRVLPPDCRASLSFRYPPRSNAVTAHF